MFAIGSWNFYQSKAQIWNILIDLSRRLEILLWNKSIYLKFSYLLQAQIWNRKQIRNFHIELKLRLKFFFDRKITFKIYFHRWKAHIWNFIVHRKLWFWILFVDFNLTFEHLLSIKSSNLKEKVDRKLRFENLWLIESLFWIILQIWIFIINQKLELTQIWNFVIENLIIRKLRFEIVLFIESSNLKFCYRLKVKIWNFSINELIRFDILSSNLK